MSIKSNIQFMTVFCIVTASLQAMDPATFTKPGILRGGKFTVKQLTAAKKFAEKTAGNKAGIVLPQFKTPTAPVKRSNKSAAIKQISLFAHEELDAEPVVITPAPYVIRKVKKIYEHAFGQWTYPEAIEVVDILLRSPEHTVIDDMKTRQALRYYGLLTSANKIIAGAQQALQTLLTK